MSRTDISWDSPIEEERVYDGRGKNDWDDAQKILRQIRTSVYDSVVRLGRTIGEFVELPFEFLNVVFEGFAERDRLRQGMSPRDYRVYCRGKER